MIQLVVNPRRNAVDAPVYTVTVDHPDHETDAMQDRSVGEFKMQNSRNTQCVAKKSGVLSIAQKGESARADCLSKKDIYIVRSAMRAVLAWRHNSHEVL